VWGQPLESGSFQNRTVTKTGESKTEREEQVYWELLSSWSGVKGRLPRFYFSLAWHDWGGLVCDEGVCVCVCVWRGLSACVSGPPGTPLPEVGRAYVSYLRKSFSVTEINRLNDRMLCWKKQTKKKHLDTHTQVYLRLAQTKRFLNLFFKMWETTNMIKRNHRF